MDDSTENMDWEKTKEYAAFERQRVRLGLSFIFGNLVILLMVLVFGMLSKRVSYFAYAQWGCTPIWVWWIRRGFKALDTHFAARKHALDQFFDGIRKRIDERHRAKLAEIEALYGPRRTSRPSA